MNTCVCVHVYVCVCVMCALMYTLRLSDGTKEMGRSSLSKREVAMIKNWSSKYIYTL